MVRITQFNLIGILLLNTLLSSCTSYHGEASNHFNGSVFFNPEIDYKRKGFGDLISWWWEREPSPWEQRSIQSISKLPPMQSSAQVTFINHSTTAVQINDVVILTDPIWSERATPVSFVGPKRMHQPAITMPQLGQVDAVVISHNHYDHFDLPTLEQLETLYQPIFIVPIGNRHLLESIEATNIVTLDWWESTQVGSVTVTLTPARHWSKRTLTDTNESLWGGYFMKSKQSSVFFAGDTGYGSHYQRIRQRLGSVDMALLPIGAYKPAWFMKDNHMGPLDVPASKRDLGAKYVMAIHFGTFPLGDDAQDEAPDVMKQVAAKQKKPKRYLVPAVGQTFVF
jgi:L-ascorbate metabolism protein UlaG (beta-lactamase superfamily)